MHIAGCFLLAALIFLNAWSFASQLQGDPRREDSPQNLPSDRLSSLRSGLRRLGLDASWRVRLPG